MEPDPPTRFVPTAQRPIREGPDPLVSFVVLVSQPEDGLGEAFDFATTQGEAGRADVLAVHRGEADVDRWLERHPRVRWIAVGAQASDDELRERGLSEATGDVVRFLDPRFPAGWAANQKAPRE